MWPRCANSHALLAHSWLPSSSPAGIFPLSSVCSVHHAAWRPRGAASSLITAAVLPAVCLSTVPLCPLLCCQLCAYQLCACQLCPLLCCQLSNAPWCGRRLAARSWDQIKNAAIVSASVGVACFVLFGLLQTKQGGVYENKHSTDVEYFPPSSSSACLYEC